MGKARVTVHAQAIRALMTSPEAQALIAQRTKAVEQACNAESSWGGYASASDEGDNVRARGRVWSYARQDGAGKTERAQRMIRNLDAG